MTADPDAAAWQQIAADLGELAAERVRDAFEWIDAELAESGSDGAIVFLLALADLDRGMPLRSILHDLMHAAETARSVQAGI